MKTFLNYILVKLFSGFRYLVEYSDFSMRIIFTPGFEKTRWNVGKMKAYVEFIKAKRRVPGYADFLNKQQSYKIKFKGLIPDLSLVPITDKESYVKKYSMDERCLDGKAPCKGVVIDESSGSTGMPTNWIRGAKERKANKRMLEFGLNQLLGNEPKFIINAFALGPWATGVNITMAFIDSSVLKSLGPDISKIENTLRFFGNQYNYVIMGYPPFLKSLVDQAQIEWDKINVIFIYGGESMSEPMRDYILDKGVKKIYGSLGASDLELNISSENDFTIALRKLLGTNKELAHRILQHQGALPMIFQFNPLDFYLETNEEGELIITLCRPYYVAPKIRYNLHDRGHVLRMPELMRILKEMNIDLSDMPDPGNDLPLLFHYGRSDMSVAYFGCKIIPADIQEVIFKIPELANWISSFNIEVFEDEAVDKQLRIHFELVPGKTLPDIDPDAIAQKIIEELKLINQDFRESLRMIPSGNEPKVVFYLNGSGPFKDKDIRIKNNYISKEKKAA